MVTGNDNIFVKYLSRRIDLKSDCSKGLGKVPPKTGPPVHQLLFCFATSTAKT